MERAKRIPYSGMLIMQNVRFENGTIIFMFSVAD